MKVDVVPQRRYRSTKDSDELGIRIIFTATATTKQERQQLRKLWEQLEDNDCLAVLLQTVKTMVPAGDG